jgi:enoyl-[acyl-carrier-protein] reductase (NADH)
MSNNLLKGKRGIVFGALNDMSIAWKVAERAVEEGASIVLSNKTGRTYCESARYLSLVDMFYPFNILKYI